MRVLKIKRCEGCGKWSVMPIRTKAKLSRSSEWIQLFWHWKCAVSYIRSEVRNGATVSIV